MGNTLINSDTRSQCKRIREYLETGAVLTPLHALRKFGCMRLGARIWDLRHTYGLDIKSSPVKVGNTGKRVAGYTLNIGTNE